ncbi:MAG: T9SS type A sorting domain-containing protein [Chitinispirillales bacterium]|nr:T9SS type A sorting domain-containing protein [Chitinispirillales bacterium]
MNLPALKRINPAAITALLLVCLFSEGFAGPMQVEKLNRGLIAVRSGSGYYLSWRLLANEPYNTGFNVYRGTTKLNNTPLTGATIYTDANTGANNVYTVRAVIDGVEREASENALVMTAADGANAAYLHIDLQRPPTGSRHNGTYSPNDGSAADLDGDGVYEMVIKWDPNNAQDNANEGFTDNVLIDAYKLDGTRIWRIDLGPNIRAGAHYTQFMVYDFDGDGKAEMMVKTAPGTRDGTNKLINMGPAANADHNKTYIQDERPSGGTRYGRVLDGPEYLTVFCGQTGAELATTDYWPSRGTVNGWGDPYGNRVDRFNAAVAYFDGERPSAVFQRGYYSRMTIAAWDWRSGQLTRRWTFDSNSSGNSAYAGQGNHQLSVADVNNDGRHEVITGAAVIGSDGRGMHTTGWGHGDALHVAHMIKGHPTPQIFMPHESGNRGILLRQASDGQHIAHIQYNGDVGRGVAAPLAPGGWYFWSSASRDLFNTNGERVGRHPDNGNTILMYNHLIWWDGDLSRETLTRNMIASWNVTNDAGSRLLTAAGAEWNNGSKENPVLTADLFGDWREEVIWRVGSDAIRIWTTTMTTTHRLVTMMHDPTYRVAVAWQNSSYNQPPHPGYYIASDMNFPPPVLDVAVVGGTAAQSPVVTVSSPTNNALFAPGQTITITAAASVSGGTISNVEFFNGTTKLGEKAASPFTFTWTNAPSGTHSVTVRAASAAGMVTTSSPVSLTVGAFIGSGEFIDSLILFDVQNAASWSVQNSLTSSTAAFGDRVGDREHTITSVPAQLSGAEWVRTAMETRTRTAPAAIAQFKMKKAGTVYIAYEDRVTTKPEWLASGGFTSTTQTMTVTESGGTARTFTIYSHAFTQGQTVTLGVNSNDGLTQSMMYLVAVRDSQTVSVVNKTRPLDYSLNIAQSGGARTLKISYSIKNSGPVRIDLFDIKGNRVSTVVNSVKNAGVYQEQLSSGKIAAGTYLIKLRTGKQTLQEKFIVTK